MRALRVLGDIERSEHLAAGEVQDQQPVIAFAGNEGKPDIVSAIPEFLRRRRVA